MNKINDVTLMSIKKRVRIINANLELNNYQHLSDLEANVTELLLLIQRQDKKRG